MPPLIGPAGQQGLILLSILKPNAAPLSVANHEFAFVPQVKKPKEITIFKKPARFMIVAGRSRDRTRKTARAW
jgi:hypothetical protein